MLFDCKRSRSSGIASTRSASFINSVRVNIATEEVGGGGGGGGEEEAWTPCGWAVPKIFEETWRWAVFLNESISMGGLGFGSVGRLDETGCRVLGIRGYCCNFNDFSVSYDGCVVLRMWEAFQWVCGSLGIIIIIWSLGWCKARGVYVKEKKWSVGAMCKILWVGGGLVQNSVVNIISYTLVRH